MEVGEKLQQAKLWPGSSLELEHRFGWLTRSALEAKVAGLERCDDRTAGENELLKLLREELENTEPTPN